MNLLLLLSALLSALTGVNGDARAAQAPVAVNRIAESVQAARPAAVIVTGRPAVAPPALAAMRIVAVLPAWRLAAPAPLYLSRRRE